jgi:hypothetical protein
VYLALSLLCLAGGLTGIGLLYAYYAACPVSQFWISLTLIVSLACLASSLLDRISMGLLTPAFLFLYFDYQCWSAILSNPDSRCNRTGACGFACTCLRAGVVTRLFVMDWCHRVSRAGGRSAVVGWIGGPIDPTRRNVDRTTQPLTPSP